MHFVYILRSISFPDQTYVGSTHDIDDRLKDHNRGHSPHTSKYVPWELITYTVFSDQAKALAFEK